MNTKRIVSAISSIAVILMVAACNTGQSMMGGNNSMGMENWIWNWPQIIGSLLIGFLLGFLVARRKR